MGVLLREWRQERKLSQLSLASQADVSARHLSFVETGRSSPSRNMILRLAEHLEVPLRGRNRMLLAAGYAPIYSESTLESPRLAMIRVAIQRLLAGHNPFPALVVDGAWNVVEANASASVLTDGAPAELLGPPMNALRYSLHPTGLASRTLNLPQWRTSVLDRLERQIRAVGRSELSSLYQELVSFPATNDFGDVADEVPDVAFTDPFVPLHILHNGVALSLFSTTTVFSTPSDATVEELHIENFYPADATTENYLRDHFDGTGSAPATAAVG